jgi:hypothetical protein
LLDESEKHFPGEGHGTLQVPEGPEEPEEHLMVMLF